MKHNRIPFIGAKEKGVIFISLHAVTLHFLKSFAIVLLQLKLVITLQDMVNAKAATPILIIVVNTCKLMKILFVTMKKITPIPETLISLKQVPNLVGILRLYQVLYVLLVRLFQEINPTWLNVILRNVSQLESILIKFNLL